MRRLLEGRPRTRQCLAAAAPRCQPPAAAAGQPPGGKAGWCPTRHVRVSLARNKLFCAAALGPCRSGGCGENGPHRPVDKITQPRPRTRSKASSASSSSSSACCSISLPPLLPLPPSSAPSPPPPAAAEAPAAPLPLAPSDPTAGSDEGPAPPPCAPLACARRAAFSAFAAAAREERPCVEEWRIWGEAGGGMPSLRRSVCLRTAAKPRKPRCRPRQGLSAAEAAESLPLLRNDGKCAQASDQCRPFRAAPGLPPGPCGLPGPRRCGCRPGWSIRTRTCLGVWSARRC